MDAENADTPDEEIVPGDDGSETGADAVEPDADKEPDKAGEEPAPAGEPEKDVPEPKKPSLADLDLDEILGDERVKAALDKMAQSAKDKELARVRRQEREDRARRDAEERERIRQEERRRFEEERDFEGLYSYDQEQEAKAKELLDHARQFTDTLVEQARRDYDQILGEDVVERIVSEVRSQSGATPITLANRLAEEQRRGEVAKASADARKSLPDLVAQEVEAKLVELGLKSRAEKVTKGEVPSNKISGDQAKGRVNKEDMTYEKASAAYGAGEMSYTDFKPFKDEHERKRRL